MATMFLKQHSVLDVTGAFIMAYLLYQWVYAEETKKVPGYSKRPVFQNKYRVKKLQEVFLADGVRDTSFCTR